MESQPIIIRLESALRVILCYLYIVISFSLGIVLTHYLLVFLSLMFAWVHKTSQRISTEFRRFYIGISRLCTQINHTTLCYHRQIKLVKPLRLLLGQHFTHFTLVRKPSEISQVTIYTPLYLRIVDQYRYFICCSLDCLFTILKFSQVSFRLNGYPFTVFTILWIRIWGIIST
jgi:hypothetical protein